jgi:hypothetical protein
MMRFLQSPPHRTELFSENFHTVNCFLRMTARQQCIHNSTSFASSACWVYIKNMVSQRLTDNTSLVGAECLDEENCGIVTTMAAQIQHDNEAPTYVMVTKWWSERLSNRCESSKAICAVKIGDLNRT